MTQTIKQALVQYLGARDGLTAILSRPNAAYQGIYSQSVPQQTTPTDLYPCVTYQRVDGTNVTALDGPSGLARARVQLVAWARTAETAEQVREILMDALNGYRGAFGELICQACILINEGDMSEDDNLIQPGLAASQIYGERLDFRIEYAEPTPTYA